ncbi:amino acid--tRNA ligase-related protein [Roseateles sp. LYH14W]|uniref:Amino acid--tRNA ligase-related protein n=1 Tax=Pelomonas parva TaxID=3299032 RepID=A0ABW7F7Q2_9BURK
MARASDANPQTTERFELFITGREHANGFSELNDAEDQAARFHAQAADKDASNEEAMFFDANFIRRRSTACRPPVAAASASMRLTMLITDSPSICDVILFPALRREA